jgi:hypothetical protein
MYPYSSGSSELTAQKYVRTKISSSSPQADPSTLGSRTSRFRTGTSVS